MEAKLDQLVSRQPVWPRSNGVDSDVVFSVRVRLARNIAGYSFVNCLSEFDREKIIKMVCDAAAQIFPPDSFWTFSASELCGNDALCLLERQLVSREFIDGADSRAVLIDRNESFAVMILEEDHLRIQSVAAGLNFDAAWKKVNDIDNEFDRRLEYTFDERLGYLTACPTNLGTAIRISAMLHLPALVQTQEIERAFRAMQKMKLAVRGMYGEGSKPFGDLFQISNQTTLGMAEEEIFHHLQTVVPKVIEYERQARKRLFETEKEQILDQIFRGIGILKSARKMRLDEAMLYLSNLRMGAYMGLQKEVSAEKIDELFLRIQPAHLEKLAGGTLDSEAELLFRAEYLRKKLG